MKHAWGWTCVVALGVLMCAPSVTQAVPAYPGGVMVQQPDGSRHEVFLRGDEFLHWHEDAHGVPVCRSGPKSAWVYAEVVNGELRATPHLLGAVAPAAVGLRPPSRAERLAMRGKAPVPPSVRTPGVNDVIRTGTMSNLVLLVAFADWPGDYPRADFVPLFNEIGFTNDGARGSVKDYYLEVSENDLTINSVVADWVTLDHGYKHYGGFGDGTSQEMVLEALAKLDQRGFDFSRLDANGDGAVDGLTVIHAGGGEEYVGNDTNYIWSHFGGLGGTITYDGVDMTTYHTEPARRGWDANPASQGITRIGVICHETGHFLGLPDLYDTDESSVGVGHFCVMAGGSWAQEGIRPTHFSAWCKKELGWITVTPVTSLGVRTLEDAVTSLICHKVQGFFPANEYFLIENRQGTGFDDRMPGSSRGLLIWHIDENQTSNRDETHYKVDVEEASGPQHLQTTTDMNGDDSDYWRQGNAVLFGQHTEPNTEAYDGTPLGFILKNIGPSQGTMSYELGETTEGDYGDAPAPYPTLLADDGAWHTPTGPTIGPERDIETDGQPHATARGDDQDGNDDEAGVAFGPPLRAGALAYPLSVDVQGARARLDAWIDFDGDGCWGRAGERIVYHHDMDIGSNSVPIAVPAWARTGHTFARFRLNTVGGLGYVGSAHNGEVEDYPVEVVAPAAGAGTFLNAHTAADGFADVRSVVGADVDLDGDLDLVSASSSDGELSWHENDGNQVFTTHAIRSTISSPRHVAVVDMDRDGDLDFLVAADGDPVAWYEKTVGFPRHPVSQEVTRDRHVCAADMDGDGDMDVLTASEAGAARVAWHENRGTHFTRHAISTAAYAFESVCVADLDRDGDLDVLSATGSNLYRHENDGSQSFSTATLSDRVAVMCVADVDGDGDVDIVTGAPGNATVAWLEQQPGGTFTRRSISASNVDAGSVSAADLDGDGDVDVVCALTGDNAVGWYENNGSQSFTYRPILTQGNSPRAVFVADADRDGDLDVLSAGGPAGTVLWHEQAAYTEDFGDAPPPYNTLLADNGPSHEGSGPRMGSVLDLDRDGVPSVDADGDDNTGVDDEDGVTFPSSMRVGELGASVTVNIQSAPSDAKLHAWIDFDHDGCWGGAYERIAKGLSVGNGNHVVPFDVPSWAVSGRTYARFRLVRIGNLTPDGFTDYGGEVEDHAFTLRPPVMGPRSFDGVSPISAGANGARSVFAADVNGDGHMDALSASFFDDRVAWYENDGRESFTRHVLHSSSDGASDVLAADVDRDGDLDIVSSSYNDDTIAWFENRGGPTFTRRRISALANGARSIFAVDLDVDGDVDILSASSVGNTILWHDNSGFPVDLGWRTRTIAADVNGAFSVFAADVDSDGDMDVLSASANDDTIAWYENDGSQGFTKRDIYTTADGARCVFAADVDSDGDVDVLSASSDDGRLNWYENDGTPAVGSWIRHIIAVNAADAFSVFAADVDGDGDTDVCAATEGDNRVAWWENNGSQVFSRHTLTTSADGALDVFAADMDDDGDLDLLSASWGDDTIAWYRQRAPMDFGDAGAPYPTLWADDGARHVASGPTLGSARDDEEDGIPSTGADGDDNTRTDDEDGVTVPASLRAGQLGAAVTVNVQGISTGMVLDAWLDFDGDGCWGGDGEQVADSLRVVNGDNPVAFDVPSWAAAGEAVARFRLGTLRGLGYRGTAPDGEVEDHLVTLLPAASGAGSFGPAAAVSPDEPLKDLLAADVDGDGDMDAISVHGNSGVIAWYDNNGSQAFTRREIATVDGPWDILATDLDGDGDLDVVSGCSNDDLDWHENDGSPGDGGWTSHAVPTTMDTSMALCAVDVDGDGDRDLVVGSYWDDAVAWFENDGRQGFTEHTVSEEADHVWCVAASDLDRDGDLDLLAALHRDKVIVWYENDGGQTFSQQMLATDVKYAQNLVVTDLDDDGDMDVLSANPGDDTVAWYENDGNQTFSTHVIGYNKDQANWVAAADIDGDGDTDVMSCDGSGTNSLVWYQNNGQQVFTERPIGLGWFGGLADMDADGDLDVLRYASQGNGIAWHEQRLGPAEIDVLGNGRSIADGDTTPEAADHTSFGGVPVDGGEAEHAFAIRNLGGRDLIVPLVTLTGGHEGDFVLTPPEGGVPTVPGGEAITFTVKFNPSVPGVRSTTVRILSTDADEDPYTFAIAGEGEVPAGVDFGDAPAPYATRLAQDGARHSSPGPQLGASRDDEGDGVPSAGADGDDLAGVDDEDGVSVAAGLRVGQVGAAVSVSVQDAGGGSKLDAWVDFNADGCWGGPRERIAAGLSLGDGTHSLSFDVPGYAVAGPAYARFRLSTAGGAAPGGTVADGEVEDYALTLRAPEAGSGSFGSARTVTHDADGPTGIDAVDVDGDGDLDVLVASVTDDTVAWCENDGTGGFTAHTIATPANNASSAHGADVDGDGDMDVLAANAYDHQVVWYENNGSQTFAGPRIVSSGLQQPRCAVSGDVDGDGDCDVVAVFSGSDTIDWFENDGSETFTRRPIGTTSDGWDVHVADVDGDGDLDAVSAARASDTVAWHENDGTGGFTTHPLSTTADFVTGVWAADVDSDGDMDVLSASRNDDTIAWYRNNGSEVFTRIPISTTAGGAWGVSVGDVDGDGDMDVLAALYDDWDILWYENDGSEIFTRRMVDSNERGAQRVLAADIDGNGVLDVVYAAILADHVDWRSQGLSPADMGDAPAPYPTLISRGGARHPNMGPRLGAARDVESDGAPTSAADGDDNRGTDDEDGVTLPAALRIGHLGASVAVDVQSAPGGAKLDAWFDLDGDGCWGGPDEQVAAGLPLSQGVQTVRVDVASWARPGETYARFRLSTAGDLGVGGSAEDGEVEDYRLVISPAVKGAGSFGSRTVVSTNGESPQGLDAADVDGDGDVDLLTAAYDSDTVTWYENDGAGAFTPHLVSALNGARDVVAADLDGDGDVDVLAVGSIVRQVVWYENDGNQGFTGHTVGDSLTQPWRLTVADLDGDGDRDVLCAHLSGDAIAWYENDGNEAFSQHVIADVDGGRCVATGDVDGDGDLDVLSASYLDNTVAWHENDGRQEFTPHTINDAAQGAFCVAAADLDGDGDLDVVSSSMTDDTVAWYRNNGSGSFTETTLSGVEDNARDVAVADLDGDGDIDVLSAAFNNDRVRWYENDGGGTFTRRTVTSAGDGAFAVLAADVDGDGVLDVVTTSTRDDELAWLSQRRPPVDFGDAPAPYPTRLAADGPRHETTGPMLGARRDAESDGAPTAAADGDDAAGSADEDGVTFAGDPQTGQLGGEALVTVRDAPAGAALDAWIDFDGDGCWGGPREQIADSLGVTNGTNAIRFDVPSWDLVGDSYARFRLSSGGELGIGGGSSDGEVEDYRLALRAPESGPGSFLPPRQIALERRVWRVRAADLDGDGDLDALAALHDRNTIAWYENDGSQAFTARVIATNVDHVADVLAADVDGDGDLDALAAADYGNHVSWYENDGTPGDGEWMGHVVDGAADGAERVLAVDLDGDGDQDILFTTDSTNGLVWCENAGGAVFLQHAIEDGAAGGEGLAGGDLNGDGHMDIVWAGHSHQSLAWFENDGSQGFTKHVITNGWSVEEIALADLDADSDLDVLVALGLQQTVACLENLGGGSFRAILLPTPAEVHKSVFAADVDGDGTLDAVARSANRLAWYKNDGALNFAQSLLAGTASAVSTVCAADVDGDGDLDLLSGDATAIAWYEQSAPAEIHVTGNGRDIADGDTTPDPDDHTDFGSAVVDGGTVRRTFTLANTGDADLHVSAIRLTGADAGDFALGGIAPPVVLTGGASTNLTVTFDPSEEGLRSATLEITNDDADESPYDFSIQGTGVVLPPVTITATAGPNGRIVPDGALVVPSGGTTNFAILADTYYHVLDVTTNGISVGAVSAFTWSNITVPGTIHAAFAPDLAGRRTPHWWLARYGLTNGGWTFDQAEGRDGDGDGHDGREEWVADTDPTDSNSCLRATGIARRSPVTVSFVSSSNRLYMLRARRVLPDGTWSNVPGGGPRIGAGGADALQDTNVPAWGPFYRLEVEVP